MHLKKNTLLACLCAVSACGGSSSTTSVIGTPSPPLVIGPTATSLGLVAAGDTVRMDLNFKSYGAVRAFYSNNADTIVSGGFVAQ